MKKKFNKGKLLKILLISGAAVYVMGIFIAQQKTLNSYKKEQVYIADQITKQEEYKESLVAMKDNVNSPEYIEEIAREMLDMYLPNERVYIDISK